MKIISTQNGELVFCQNIISISQVEGEGTENGRNVKLYGCTALDVLGKDHELGLYETQKRSDEVFDELQEWLSVVKLDLYQMPE
jgi:hypothetical protein